MSTDTPTAERDVMERLRATYAAWNNPPSEGLPEGADILLSAADEITRLRAELEQARERLTRDRLLTIMSDSAAQVDRARPADERDGPAWNGPGGDWWELFEETVSAQLELGAPSAPEDTHGNDA